MTQPKARRSRKPSSQKIVVQTVAETGAKAETKTAAERALPKKAPVKSLVLPSLVSVAADLLARAKGLRHEWEDFRSAVETAMPRTASEWIAEARTLAHRLRGTSEDVSSLGFEEGKIDLPEMPPLEAAHEAIAPAGLTVAHEHDRSASQHKAHGHDHRPRHRAAKTKMG